MAGCNCSLEQLVAKLADLLLGRRRTISVQQIQVLNGSPLQGSGCQFPQPVDVVACLNFAADAELGTRLGMKPERGFVTNQSA